MDGVDLFLTRRRTEEVPRGITGRKQMLARTQQETRDVIPTTNTIRVEIGSILWTDFCVQGCYSSIDNTGYLLHAILSREHIACYNHMVTNHKNIVTQHC